MEDFDAPCWWCCHSREREGPALSNTLIGAVACVGPLLDVLQALVYGGSCSGNSRLEQPSNGRLGLLSANGHGSLMRSQSCMDVSSLGHPSLADALRWLVYGVSCLGFRHLELPCPMTTPAHFMCGAPRGLGSANGHGNFLRGAGRTMNVSSHGHPMSRADDRGRNFLPELGWKACVPAMALARAAAENSNSFRVGVTAERCPRRRSRWA